MKQKLISIIIPAYNEEQNVLMLYKELSKSIRRQPYKFELIFVDDGSADNTVKILKKLAVNNDDIRLICLARNFGKEPATSAGLHSAQGDAAIIIDADLQMPPRLLKEFIQKWEKGADIVVGVFESRDLSKVKKAGAFVFYKIMQVIAHTKITPNATDFRLLDRKVLDVFNQLTERNRINRGMIDWMGFERDYIYFKQAARHGGEASYDLRKLISLATNSFIAHSFFPLKLAGYLGVVILLFATVSGSLMAIEKFVLHDPLGLAISGTAFLAVMLLFLVGVVLACLGLISLYIAHIHTEVINRPLYIVRDTHESEKASLIPQTESAKPA